MTTAAAPDDQFYTRALKRIYRNLIGLAVAGGIVAAVLKGPLFGVGFVVGSLGAILTFGWFHYLASGLSAAATGEEDVLKPSTSKRAIAWALGLRYLLFGAAAYVMLKYLGISNVAFLLGLLIVAPAVLIEILTEIIIYART